MMISGLFDNMGIRSSWCLGLVLGEEEYQDMPRLRVISDFGQPKFHVQISCATTGDYQNSEKEFQNHQFGRQTTMDLGNVYLSVYRFLLHFCSNLREHTVDD